MEEETQEQESLKDQEESVLGPQGNEDLNRYMNSSDFSHVSANEDNLEYATGRSITDLDSDLDHAGSHLDPEIPTGLHIKQSASCGSFESFSSPYGDGGFASPFGSGFASPLGSPLKPKHKPTVGNVSPELLHLVDSAIMGKVEGMERLKRLVSGKESFGRDEDAECIALLVVDSLLATMGGVESFEEGEDNNPPSVMLNSRAATVAGELIPSLPCEGDYDGFMSPRTRMVKGLLAILRACTRNRSMCSTAGLLGVLLDSAETIFIQDLDSSKQLRWDGTALCQCIQYLAAHSLNVIDLNRWLQVITRTLTTVWANRLLLSLEKAMGGKESRGPTCTFEFDGESSGLLGPGENRWPFPNGYGFATWIYVESFADNLNTATAAAEIAAAKSSAMSPAAAASALAGEGTTHMPRLFSFQSADNQVIEAYFHARFLVVECGSGKGKKASLHFTHAFKPQHWYFIGLEHTCKQGVLGKAESELRLYIDGSLIETRPFEFLRTSKPLAFCCIGTNPPPTMAGLQRRRRQCPLFAEMGPVYIFKEIIGPERMARLASRGGNVLPSFGHGAGLPWLATNEHVRNLAAESALLDAEIAESLHLLYHPKLLSGRFCPDISPSGAAATNRRPAEVLGQVHVACRMRPAEALWALAYGGPMSLLPLVVSNVHERSMEPLQGSFQLSSVTASLSASIFRIISMAIQYPGNNEELRRRRGPEVLSRILNYLLRTMSSLDLGKQNGVGNEELVASVVSLCQSQKNNYALKVQLFSTLLLDLKMWSLCNYGLQKKLLSSLADMVFTESSVMRDANAMQMLLDSCRRCYWVIREKDSVDTFSLHETPRPIGEVNALVDELLVVIELLMGGAPSSAVEDMRCLIGFLVDCPQANQVARVLHLIYRLVVQPNTSRAHTFAESFISSGGIETLLVLLQREAKAGDHTILEDCCTKNEENGSVQGSVTDTRIEDEGNHDETLVSAKGNESVFYEAIGSEFSSENFVDGSILNSIGRRTSVSENLVKNLGGIGFPITADSARNNVYNIDNGDGVVVRIIGLLGTLVASKHLKFSEHASSKLTSSILGNGLHDGGGTMFDDKLSLLLFALQKAFQAAPSRLLTSNVYMALLAASINASTTDDGLNIYDHGHRFEHVHLLLVLLRALPYASRAFQVRAVQDILFLACSHPENRGILTGMEEWPEWILEVLISNYERGSSNCQEGASISDIEDLIHNFLIIMLEHSMRQKDGWKDIEATVHCAEWLTMVGGSSTGDQRMRREESLPIIKRRLLGGLMDFSTGELQIQTQVVAAAAAGVAAEGLSPEDAKLEAERASQLSVALADNAIVILMLVEDHLRLQSQLHTSSRSVNVPGSPSPASSSVSNRSSSVGRVPGEPFDAVSSQRLLSAESGGLSLGVLASVADPNGQVSAEMMERLAAAAAAEPYESVRCAFVSYGSCASDLSKGWKCRSWLWYGLGLPSKASSFGGGGSGWECWKTSLEKDASGNWIELPLVKKSVLMLQTLLLDESELGGGLGIGGGSGTGMGGMTALYQLLDSDQPFLCMLRMVLVSIREEDNGVDSLLVRSGSMKDNVSEGTIGSDSTTQSGIIGSESNTPLSARKPRSALLWSVLSPVLNMPISEKKRQRVLVASSVLYSEVWHAVDKERNLLRKQYLETILPPFAAILRRWRPLLAGIHELTSSDGLNPLVVDDRALAADALPLEAALAMISPGWAAAFASPPAAMALAMIAAGAAGGETVTPSKTAHLRRDASMFERRQARLHTFSSFQKPLETQNKSPALPKDKAAAKAAALAAARDLERNAKIGSGRGLSAVAMATSAQRRYVTDMGRTKRWNDSEAMGTAWTECLQSVDTKSVSGKDFNALCYKYIAVLVASFALARTMQRSEIDRRTQVDLIHRHCLSTGSRSWRKLIHCLIETRSLFGPFGEYLYNPERIFWKLDRMESSSRMRRCLRRNYTGSGHLGASANYEDRLQMKDGQDNITCPASIVAAEAISLEEANADDEQTETNSVKDAPEGSFQKEDTQSSQSGDVSEDLIVAEVPTDQDLVQSPSAVAPGYVAREDEERIIFELSSSMVRPLRITHGTFQVTTKRINFIVTGVTDDNAMKDEYSRSKNRNQGRDRSWLMSSLHQMLSRRYLLRRSALELFMVDRSNFFFDFGSVEGRKNAHRAIVQARPPHLNSIYLAIQRPGQLLKRSQLMERWARWEISNFDYLMQLNTLAGRSYNDITQYPVFPWILADYNSETLDLKNHASYRDLSKPIGALNPDRLKKFQERYATFDDPVIPKFHYSSHYSSARTVLYYLVRVEPFTTLSIQLQDGKFDHADRMFSDIGATWNGVLEDMSDVKELVPEMFYLPECLANLNSIDFGTTKLGGKLDSVRLPPWAENSVDFIHKHRKALESEYVSAHLHEWIDLIYGYKQRGKEAISANNVFSYITYEGTVDIDKISDPVQQRSIQDQISYFGQTPSQLLTVPHLKRMPLKDVLHLQTIFRNPTQVKPHVVPNPECCNLPAASIYASSDSVIVVDVNAPAAHVALHKWQPNTPDGQGTPFHFQHGKAMTNSADGAFKRMFKGAPSSGSEDLQFPQSLAFATSGIRSSSVVAITCDKEIITGGHIDNSVKLISADEAKTIETAEGHCAPVTCLALSPDCKYLVTGSRDTTLILWRVHRASPSQSSISEPSVSSSTPRTSSSGTFSNIAESSRKRRIEGPMHVLRGHMREIMCCCVNSDLGFVVSCSFSSGILLHSVRKGRLIRRLLDVEAHLVCLSSVGVILAWNKLEQRLSTFTINGAPIATTYLSFSGSISCMEISVDGESVLIGTSSVLDNGKTYDTFGDFGRETDDESADRIVELSAPSISFLDMHTLKVFHTLKLGKKQDITTLALNKDNTNLLVSTADKQLIIFTKPTASKNS